VDPVPEPLLLRKSSSAGNMQLLNVYYTTEISSCMFQARSPRYNIITSREAFVRVHSTCGAGSELGQISTWPTCLSLFAGRSADKLQQKITKSTSML
jgi:hypothetical protein